LSTFHGCPPDEIERILGFLLEHHQLDCNVKLNPMLLGPARLRELLHDVMGYRDIVVPDSAFTRDASWAQMRGFVGRLGDEGRRARPVVRREVHQHADRREPSRRSSRPARRRCTCRARRCTCWR
jgi:hypothetical protein